MEIDRWPTKDWGFLICFHFLSPMLSYNQQKRPLCQIPGNPRTLFLSSVPRNNWYFWISVFYLYCMLISYYTNRQVVHLSFLRGQGQPALPLAGFLVLTVWAASQLCPYHRVSGRPLATVSGSEKLFRDSDQKHGVSCYVTDYAIWWHIQHATQHLFFHLMYPCASN